MGDGFQVDLGSMSQLISSLRDVAQSITDANTALKNASATQLGHDDLDSAGGALKDRWDYGTGKISDLTGKMVDALTATLQVYQDIENQVAHSFQAQGSTSAPAGTSSAAGSGASRTHNALAGRAS